jgi:hypothetical protein
VWENDTLDAGDVGAIPTTEKGVANGVASLGADGRVVEDTELVFGYRGTSQAYVTFNHSTQTNSPSPTEPGRVIGGFLLIHNSQSFDRISANVTSEQSAGAVQRLGIYKVNIDGTYTLVVDAGTIDGTITGNQDIIINVTLTKGVYFLCLVGQGYTGTSGSLRAGAGYNSQYADGQTLVRVNPIPGTVIATNITGALPASITNAYNALVQMAIPLVYLRKA